MLYKTANGWRTVDGLLQLVAWRIDCSRSTLYNIYLPPPSMLNGRWVEKGFPKVLLYVERIVQTAMGQYLTLLNLLIFFYSIVTHNLVKQEYDRPWSARMFGITNSPEIVTATIIWDIIKGAVPLIMCLWMGNTKLYDCMVLTRS